MLALMQKHEHDRTADHAIRPMPIQDVAGREHSRLQLTCGIEEEFFLSDADSRDATTHAPSAFLRECRRRLGDRIAEELLGPQVEAITPVLHGAAQARDTVLESRAVIGAIATGMGLRLVASGTHPLARWRQQAHTPRERYERLIDDYQIVGRRNLLCGLHVHVGVPPEFDRIVLMNRLMAWLPVFLAVSTSSPFWDGRPTGLLSYRQCAYDEWPRSGIPDAFADETEYAAFIDLLARCDALRDGSFLWWAIRPSTRFPTLELRIADACTRAGDALAIAAAFRCLVRAHLRRPELGGVRSAITRRVIDENRWRAKRHGAQAEFIDEMAGDAVAFDEVMQNLLEIIAPDAQALRCEDEIRHFAAIPSNGSSAHAQLAIYRGARERGQSEAQALRRVVDWLAGTTVRQNAERRHPPSFQSDGCVLNA